MEDSKIFERFVRYTTDIPILRWDGRIDSLKEFADKHCLLSQIQPMFTSESLQLVLEHIQPLRIYISRDLLGLNVLFIRFDGADFIVGPFADQEWEDEAHEKILASASLPISYLLPYKLHYCSYSLLELDYVFHVLTGTAAALHPQDPPYDKIITSGHLVITSQALFKQEPLDYNAAVLRYEKENRFLKLLSLGHPNAAMKEYEQLEKLPADIIYSRNYTKTLLANAAIVRTLTRKAAEQGGVHPTIVDAISLSYAQRLCSDSLSAEEILSLIRAMIMEFGEAVRAAHRENWSAKMHPVVSYITLHLSQEISTAKLAEISGFSESYLGKQFKRESGMTISQYIAKKRCEKAAELLRGTMLSIQEISTLVGYWDNNYFVKVFKPYYQVTPSVYRKKTTFLP